MMDQVKFVVRDGSAGVNILTAQKTSSGGAVGIQTSPVNNAALKLGSKGLLFSAGNSTTPITGVDSVLGNPGSDARLVTEKAIRTAITSAIDGQFTFGDITSGQLIDSETSSIWFWVEVYTINKRAVDGNGNNAPQPPTIMNLASGQKAIAYCIISTGDGGGGFLWSLL